MKHIIDRFKLYFNKSKDYEELRSYPLFANLDNYDLFLLWQRMHQRTYRSGETLYEDGYPVEVFYFIFEGEVELRRTAAPNEITLITKGMHLGLRDLYFNQMRNGTATAKTAVTVHALSHNDFKEYIETRPKTGLILLEDICREFAQVIFEEHED